MARKFPVLPSLSNVSAGSTATLVVPLGVTYHKIDFVYSGVTLDQIKDIRIKINGKTIQEYASGTRLNALNSYYNREITAGVLSLWFDSTQFDNITLRRATAIGTQDVATFQIEMSIDGAAVAPVISAIGTVSPNTPLGMIKKVKNFVSTNSATGVKEIADLPREGRIASMFLFKPDISKVEVDINSVKVYEPSKTVGEVMQRGYGRVPDSAAFTAVDFNLEGDPMQGLVVQGASDFRLRATYDTAGSADLVVEYLTGFAGI